MASLLEITKTIRTVTGLGEFDVAYRARVLRESGILPESKRGRGATPMYAKEAARILLACLVADSPAKIVQLTKTYCDLHLKAMRVNGHYSEKITELPAVFHGMLADVIEGLLKLCTTPEGCESISRVVKAIQVKRVSPTYQMPLATIDLLLESPTGPYIVALTYMPKNVKWKGSLEGAVGFVWNTKHPGPIAGIQVTAAMGGGILTALGSVLRTDEAEPVAALDWSRLQLVA